jgi:predicted dehydrogenase
MTLAPGHFHAALVHKAMDPGISPRVHVYAPLDADLVAHLDRVVGFNARQADPTAWEFDVRAGANYLERFLREQPGGAVVIAGRNRPKIDRILAAVSHGVCVLADKPWVIAAADFPKLEQVFREADLRDAVAWDMMTERFEVTSALQRALLRDSNVFGSLLTGTPDDPALTLESVHYLRKAVAGAPLRRPTWWFDPDEAGEALADVGTHLADLALWLLFPDQPIDHRRDVRVLDATTWPTPLLKDQFVTLTGLPDLPEDLAAKSGAGDVVLYRGNGTATFTVCGVHVRITTLWDFEPAAGGTDAHEAVARGTKARVAVRPSPAPDGGTRPELFVTANDPADHRQIVQAVEAACRGWQVEFPGVAVVDLGQQVHVQVPDDLRVGHEAHFAAVLREFVSYYNNPRQIPHWERSNLLAKYFITTTALELARQKQGT